MKFSVFTVGTPDLTLNQTVEKAKKYGYDAVEWRVLSRPKSQPVPLPPRPRWYWEYNQATLELHNIQQEAQDINVLCENAGLKISSLSTYLSPDQPEQILSVLQAAKSINCPRIRIMAPGYNGEGNYNKIFYDTQTQLTKVVEMATEYGVKVALEIHHYNIIPSASAAYRLVSAFDSDHIGVIYDPGNMVHEGYEQYPLGITLLGKYLDHVHIKDARPVFDRENNMWTIDWCPIGEGMVNFQTLIDTLRSFGYDGYLSTEDFSNEYNTDEKLAHNIAYLRNVTGVSKS